MKTEDRSSAHQYSHALLQLTEQQGNEEDVYKNLEVVGKVFQEQPELSVLFRHPSISAPDKKKFIEEFASHMDPLSGRLLQMLCERRKLHLLPLIVEDFKQLLRDKHNIVTGKLISAEPMTDEQVSNIKRKLIRQLTKHVELTVEIDKSLLGGYVLRMGDQVIDGSLKGRLQSIEKALLSV
jgi:F-type H+-transporting ATPase subunit delta